MKDLERLARWFALAVATIAAAAATVAFAVIYGITALLEAFGSMAVVRWSESLNQDYRDDPTYKRKLAELIERNRQFEEARDNSNKALNSIGDRAS